MGSVGVVQSTKRADRDSAPLTEVIVDTGGGANVTADYAQGVGDDALPLPNDFLVLVPTNRTGGYVAIGGVDALNQGEAAAGERRLYARNALGVIVATVWLKGDGSIEIKNQFAGASVSIAANGDMSMSHPSNPSVPALSITAAGVNINGVIINSTGVIRATNIVVGPDGATVGLLSHLHATTGAPPAPTAAPTPNT